METVTKKNSQRLIKEAIRKIALGRSIDRIDMAPSGSSGVGTARMIHGYVVKIHDDPNDEEFEDYGGTIDVREFADETGSSEPTIHKGVLLSGNTTQPGGFLIVPTLHSDVTIVSDAATRNLYILNYSEAEVIHLTSHKEVILGVTETEELDAEDPDSPDYDELEETGNKTSTTYTALQIETKAVDESGKEATVLVDSSQIAQTVNGSTLIQTEEEIKQTVDKSEIRQSTDQITHTVSDCKITQNGDKITLDVGGTVIVVQGGKVSIGDGAATEPLVLGQQLVQLMMDFINACINIKTPTMLGTMPAINIPEFAALLPKLQNFLSKTSFTK